MHFETLLACMALWRYFCKKIQAMRVRLSADIIKKIASDPEAALTGKFQIKDPWWVILWFADLGCHFCDLRLNSVDGLINIDCFRLSAARGCD